MARQLMHLGGLLCVACATVGESPPAVPSAVERPPAASAARPRPSEPGARLRWIEAQTAAAVATGRKSGPAPSGDVDADLVSVELLRVSGEAGAADDVLRALLQADPDDPVVCLRVAEIEARLGRTADALRLLERASPFLDAMPGARALRGRLWIEAGRAADGERTLRALLQDDEEGPVAAFALVDLLTIAERFGDALAVVSAVRARDPDRLDLQVVHARLLHDVWDLEGASAVLEASAALHPDVPLVALQRAELAVAAGDRSGAVEALSRVTSDDPFARAHRDRVLGVQAALESDPPSLTARDLLAMIRGAPSAGARRQAFEALLGEELLRRAAVAAALGQSDPILRVVAVRALQPEDPMFTDGLEQALADPDPRVRGAAARRLPEAGDASLGLDLARTALVAEENPYAFRAVHEALTVLVGAKVVLPPGGESDPSVRSKTRQAWSRECPE